MSRFGRNDFVAFSEIDGFSLLESRKKGAIEEINRQSDDYILNVNKSEYIVVVQT